MPTLDSLLANPSLFALLCVAAFFVGLSKGGMPAIAMLSVPILSLVMSPIVAAVLLLPIYIISDIFSVWLYRREYSAVNLKTLIPAGILGVLFGWATAAYVSDKLVSLLLGIMGITFCLHVWLRNNDNIEPKLPNTRRGLFWGTLAGFTSFISHAGGPPYQVYVLPQQMPKMVFAGTSTILFAAINLAKVVPYSALHPYSKASLLASSTLIPIAALGTLFGRYLIKQLSEKWFYLAVQIALFLISIKLVISSIQ